MKKEPIKLIHGGIERLAESTGYSRETVRKALNWKLDSEAHRLIRKRATELNLVREF